MKMPPLIVDLQSKYTQLQPRDRTAVNGLVVFFSALVLYFGLWQPVMDFRNQNQADRDDRFSLIQYMRASETAARSAASSSGAGRQVSGSLLSTVSGAAQRMNIKPNRLQPEGNDTVSVWFDSVAFDTLVTWLTNLQDREGLTVMQISVDRDEQPGMVRARIVLGG